jgi:hypothetical protein
MIYVGRELIARAEALYPTQELEQMRTEEGPWTYRHVLTSTPTYGSRMQTEASRVKRDIMGIGGSMAWRRGNQRRGSIGRV